MKKCVISYTHFLSVQNNGLSTAVCKRNAAASEALVCPEFEFPFSDNLS